MKLSVSMLSAYLYCPRMLFLQKVLELEEAPKEALVLGSVRHEAFDLVNKNEENLVVKLAKSADFAYLLQLYKQSNSRILRNIIIKNKPKLREVDVKLTEAFKKNWPSLQKEAEARALNIHSFIEKRGIYGKELWEK